MADELSINVQAVADIGAAAAGVGVLVTITNSQLPVFTSDDIPDGVHVIAAGNNNWMRAELDPRLIGRCSQVVVDDLDQARLECGELMRAVDLGLLAWNMVIPLAEVVSGSRSGRASDADLTLFESQGIGLEDVALAHHLYRAATELGRGLALS
jgi:ornithine cyclodeaminase